MFFFFSPKTQNFKSVSLTPPQKKIQHAEKAVSFMFVYLMLHKLAYIVHLFEMKGMDR